MRSVDQPISRSLGEKIYDACIHVQGEHHEFSSGLHGRKLELDKIGDGDPIYEELLDATAEKIKVIAKGVPLGKIALIGVANGANRLVEPVARRLEPDADRAEDRAIRLFTDKSDHDNLVRLTSAAILAIANQKPELALFLDDVGTTGGSVLSSVAQAKWLGAKRSEVLYAVSRKIILPELEKARVPYYSVEDVHLDDYLPEDCATDPEGYCAQGWRLIKRGET